MMGFRESDIGIDIERESIANVHERERESTVVHHCRLLGETYCYHFPLLPLVVTIASVVLHCLPFVMVGFFFWPLLSKIYW